MGDPMVDQMTRLKLKLLEKRLQNERENMDYRAESAQSTGSYDGQADALHSALRKKRDLLQRLKEQHMLEDLSRPQTWGGTRRRHRSDYYTAPPPPAPIHIHHPAPALPPPPPPAPPQPPRIIQQTIPQQPATIIQQMPQQPLIAQIPPPQPYPAPRSGSIKEDMVEMMLMQNAQMHQIIMHNMMLKAIPPMAMTPPGASHCSPHTPHQGQDSSLGNPIIVRSETKPKGSTIHHHHHYGPATMAAQLPPIGYPTWPSMMTSVPGQGGAHCPSVQHVTGPVTLPPLNTFPMEGYNTRVPLGL